MSILHWVLENKRPNLILFVHGLTGGLETWRHDEVTSFPELLLTQSDMAESCDIACFNYFTEFLNSYGKVKVFFGKSFGSIRKDSANLPVDELAELLKTEFQVNLMEYHSIIIIAHSMGGLITKACILKQLEENQITPVNGFISLAVPHSGSKLADIGGLVSKSSQIKDLKPLSDAVDSLNRKWIQVPNKPRTKYFYGSYDTIVDKKSALAIDSFKQDSLAFDEDHSSICKPKDINQNIFRATRNEIIDILKLRAHELQAHEFVDTKQFDDEYFVLKMVIADIHEDISGHAKEYFFHAELARKIFTSDRDRGALSSLYGKIKNIYQDEYQKHLATKSTPDELIYSVHSRIMSENDTYLKALLGSLSDVHKKGMLHQLANKNDRTIVWSESTNIGDLEKMRGR